MTRLNIDPEACSWSFQTGSGPGGQNVNKVATAVRLRFDLASAKGLSPGIRMRAARLAGRRLAADGSIQILANRHRTQAANRQEALARLLALLKEAATPPRPRVATRPGKAARARRLAAKRHRASVKASRSAPSGDV
ncbi:MAG: alternative ribosome rescue aminoacyl-tRNA hydrolase ArfB [Sphingomonadaceae bacterium]